MSAQQCSACNEAVELYTVDGVDICGRCLDEFDRYWDEASELLNGPIPMPLGSWIRHREGGQP